MDQDSEESTTMTDTLRGAPLDLTEKGQIDRNNLGQFTRGVSGNPAGKPKGSKSRTTIIKQAMEEALTRDAAVAFNDIVTVAIDLARGGDKDMIKFVLGDVLKEARRMESDEEDSKKIGKIEISFSPFAGVPGNAEKAIEAEFTEVETRIKIDPPS
jgi:hypothetical protein